MVKSVEDTAPELQLNNEEDDGELTLWSPDVEIVELEKDKRGLGFSILDYEVCSSPSIVKPTFPGKDRIKGSVLEKLIFQCLVDAGGLQLLTVYSISWIIFWLDPCSELLDCTYLLPVMRHFHHLCWILFCMVENVRGGAVIHSGGQEHPQLPGGQKQS